MPSIEDRLAKVIDAQVAAQAEYNRIAVDYPEVWTILQRIEEVKELAKREKESIREELIAQHDFDNHQVKGYNISVSRTVKLAVANPDQVSPDYKKTEEVIDVKKAQEYAKVMGRLPKGFEDKSVYRLNWKEVKNA